MKVRCGLTWDARVKGCNSGPFPGTLLPSGVQNLVSHGFAIVVLELENVGGDVNQERVEYTLVPFEENVCDLIVREIDAMPEDFIGLSDQLHVTIFNAWKVLNTGIIVIDKSLNYRYGPS